MAASFAAKRTAKRSAARPPAVQYPRSRSVKTRAASVGVRDERAGQTRHVDRVDADTHDPGNSGLRRRAHPGNGAGQRQVQSVGFHAAAITSTGAVSRSTTGNVPSRSSRKAGSVSVMASRSAA